MNLICASISHKTASLHQRERFQISSGELVQATQAFKEFSDATEAVVVTTCNRMEFYFVSNGSIKPDIVLKRFFSSRGVASEDDRKGLFKIRWGANCIRHLFDVACGLDSIILGESQIVSQLKFAYGAACASSSPGPLLHKAFHMAFHVSKVVRSKTGLSDGISGYAGAAVDMARNELMVDYPHPRLVIIGVNSSTEIILSRLARSAARLTLVNRSPDKAGKMAQAFGATVEHLERLREILPGTDLLFTATSAPDYILTHDLMPARLDSPMTIFDLAVPRDVDPAVAAISGVKLVDLDGLKSYLDSSQRARKADLKVASEIIDCHLTEFEAWRNKATGTEAALRAAMEADRAEILEKARASFASREQRALEAFSRQLCRQLIRRATAAIRHS